MSSLMGWWLGRHSWNQKFLDYEIETDRRDHAGALNLLLESKVSRLRD